MRKFPLTLVSCIVAAMMLSIVLAPISEACTEVYVGKDAAEDGHVIIARSSDTYLQYNTHVVVRNHNEMANGIVKDQTGLEYRLPSTTYGHIAVPLGYICNGAVYESITFNECGLIVSATLTIEANEAALTADPLVEKNSISEDSMPEILAFSCATAKEAVDLLLKIVDEHGSYGSEVIMMADEKEAWYVALYTGHQYAAVKMPTDKASVSGNEGLLTYLEDYEEKITSKDFEKLAVDNGFASYDDGKLNLWDTYSGDSTLMDICHMRTWMGQRMLSPSTTGGYTLDMDLEQFFTPDRKVSVTDVMNVMRSRYEGTPYDIDALGTTEYRALGYEKQTQVHVAQLYPEYPNEMSIVVWVCLSQSPYATFVPISNYVSSASEPYMKDADHTYLDLDSAFGVFKTINTIAGKDPKHTKESIQAFWGASEKDLADMYPYVLKKANDIYKTDKDKARQYITDYCNLVQMNTFETAKFMCESLEWYQMVNHCTYYQGEPPNFIPSFNVNTYAEQRGWTVAKIDKHFTFTKGSDVIELYPGDNKAYTMGTIYVNGTEYETNTTLLDGKVYIDYTCMSAFGDLDPDTYLKWVDDNIPKHEADNTALFTGVGIAAGAAVLIALFIILRRR